MDTPAPHPVAEQERRAAVALIGPLPAVLRHLPPRPGEGDDEAAVGVILQVGMERGQPHRAVARALVPRLLGDGQPEC